MLKSDKLTPEQSVALVAALERDRGVIQWLGLKSMSELCVYGFITEVVDRESFITEGGRIVAQQCKRMDEEKRILELTRELSDVVLSRAEFVWVELGVWRCMWCRASHMDEGHHENCRFAWIKNVINKTTAHREMAKHNKMLVDSVREGHNKDREISILKDEIDQAQKTYWRPIAECGELPDGRYVILCISGYSRIRGHWSGEWDRDVTITHILYLGPNPVTVPAAPEKDPVPNVCSQCGERTIFDPCRRCN